MVLHAGRRQASGGRRASNGFGSSTSGDKAPLARHVLTVDRPGHLVAQVDAPGRRILAFTERFHHGWSATSDGVPLRMVRVEGDFLGCVVDAGVPPRHPPLHAAKLRLRIDRFGDRRCAARRRSDRRTHDERPGRFGPDAAGRRDRRLVTILIVALLGTATCFRLMHLSSVPGISGDEGWWGVQALRMAVEPAVRSPHDQRQSDRSVLPDSGRPPPRSSRRRRSCCCARFRHARQPAGASSRLPGSCGGCTAAPRRGFTQWRWRSCRRRLRTAASARILLSRSSGRASSSICRCSASRNRARGGLRWRGACSYFPGRALDAPDQRLHRRRSCSCRCASAVRRLAPASRARRAIALAAVAIAGDGRTARRLASLSGISPRSNPYLDKAVAFARPRLA